MTQKRTKNHRKNGRIGSEIPSRTNWLHFKCSHYELRTLFQCDQFRHSLHFAFPRSSKRNRVNLDLFQHHWEANKSVLTIIETKQWATVFMKEREKIARNSSWCQQHTYIFHVLIQNCADRIMELRFQQNIIDYKSHEQCERFQYKQSFGFLSLPIQQTTWLPTGMTQFRSR